MASLETKQFEKSFYYVLEALRDYYKSGDMLDRELEKKCYVILDNVIKDTKCGKLCVSDALKIAANPYEYI